MGQPARPHPLRGFLATRSWSHAVATAALRVAGGWEQAGSMLSGQWGGPGHL